VTEAKSSQPDFSIVSRRLNGVKLVTQEIALQLARLVHGFVEGAESLAANEPLLITEAGDDWVITGSRTGSYDGTLPGLVGPLSMRISQYDAQILSYAMALHPIESTASPPTNYTN
jgi:hypothetical protein